jgi:hypothetical protein
VLDDGTPARLTATAFDALGEPGVGTVTFVTTGGVLEAGAVDLLDGYARVQLRCPADGGCPAGMSVTASWSGLTATRDLLRSHAVPPGTDAGAADAGGDAGSGDAGHADAGTLADVTGEAPLWWHTDGGVYVVPAGEEPVTFSCLGWDGGAHPGFTLPGGAPFAFGCQGQPVDFASTDAVSDGGGVDVCGEVALSEPMLEPVRPRGLLVGRFGFIGEVPLNGWRLQCLRDPNFMTYRVRVEADAGFALGLGARTFGFGTSLFGWYDGTAADPITDPEVAAQVTVGTDFVDGLDFGVGTGRRPGDP